MALSRFKLLVMVAVVIMGITTGCAISGTVINQNNFETRLSSVRLKNPGDLKVFCGGATRMVSLKLIRSVIINPAIRMTVDEELYYSAEITLKDGKNIQSTQQDKTLMTNAFICIHGLVIGKNEREHFSTGLENVLRITME